MAAIYIRILESFFLKLVDKIVLLIYYIFHAFLCPAHLIHLDISAGIFFMSSACPANHNRLNIPDVTLYKRCEICSS